MKDVVKGRQVNKRKSQGKKSYAEPESSEDDKPLVRSDFAVIRSANVASTADYSIE
jgi:hypothetical protein